MNLSSFLRRLPAERVLSKTKDSLVAVGAKDRFNQLIRPHGRVLDFQLNSRERTLFASFRLKGEVEALQFWIRQYKVVENKKGKTFIVVDGKDVDTSREWLTKLIGDQLGRQKILIPEQLNWLSQLLRSKGKELGGRVARIDLAVPNGKNSFLSAAVGVRRVDRQFFDRLEIYAYRLKDRICLWRCTSCAILWPSLALALLAGQLMNAESLSRL